MSFTTFRSPSNSRYTRSLFHECQQEMINDSKPFDPPYSLMNDYPGVVNLRKVYVSLGDPSGYKLAAAYLEDYDHWRVLMKCKWFVSAKEKWDEELDAKLSAEGLNVIRSISDGFEGLSPAVQLQAAKYLADKAYRKDKAPAPRGRPSKEEVAGILKQTVNESSDIADDLARIRSVK